MIIPSYWAESRVQHKTSKKQITVRRSGWSDLSQSDAERMAEERARQALELILTGEKLTRREPKVSYNGADGLPIREEVLAWYGDVVITRNSYGAKCLNTPDVLFADVDFPEQARIRFKLMVFVLLALLILQLGKWEGLQNCQSNDGLMIGILLVLALFFTGPLVDWFNRLQIKVRGGYEKIYHQRLKQFLKRHPDWNVRLYRTPAGLRFVATQQLFQPADLLVNEFFSFLQADPLYVRMCHNQQCFRARLTAKPWRLGVTGLLSPRSFCKWPVKPERMAARTNWLAFYDKEAAKYAACRFIEALGSGVVHPKVEGVIALHDFESKATIPNVKIA